MKEIPENKSDVRKILLNQIVLIKQESETHPEKIVELTIALCEAVVTLLKF